MLRALFVTTLFFVDAAHTQGFPDKARPMRIVVPAGAGSSGDLLGRALAKAMSDVSGLNVIVENKPGAEMVIGIQSFLAAPADGYTLLLTSSSSQTLNVVMIPNLPYDPLKDMVPLNAIGKSGLVMNLGVSTQFRTGREFVAAARASPGKYTCASSSTTTRMACDLLQATAAVKMLNVPYKTAAAALMGVAGGEADVVFLPDDQARAQWQAGRMRGVAVTQTSRMATLPNLPTLREEGLPEYDLTVWYAMYVGKNTPPEAVSALRDIVGRANRTKPMLDTLAGFSLEPLDLVGADVTAHNRREIETWTKLVKSQALKLAN
ncbi:tripartite tricarboxylate transporter substrate binding protein [Variovorax paradoxus]|nr:tripartite tricarboxylate transporter substrate binding protein [Variovorax paradoxus]